MPLLHSNSLIIVLVIMSFSLISAANGSNKKYLGDVKYCDNITRQQFVKRVSSYQKNSQIESTISSYFPANRDALVQGFLQPNTKKIFESINPYIGQYILHIGSLLILFLLYFIVIPILFCTSCCGRCCSKQPQQKFNGCQMKWPSICAIFLIIGLIAVCSILLKINTENQTKIQDIKCSIATISSDMLRGGEVQNGTVKWIGLENYQNQVLQIAKSINDVNDTIQENLMKNTKTMKDSQESISKVIDLIAKIPSSTTAQLQLRYQKPLLSDNPVTVYRSLLVDIIGTNKTQKTLTYAAYQQAKKVKDSLTALSEWAQQTNETYSTMDSKSLSKPISQTTSTAQQLQRNILSTINITQKGIQKVYWIGTYVLLGFTIFVAFILCLQIMCLSFCDKFTCKPQMSCCCALIWLVGILHFAVAVSVAGFNPIAYNGCSYARQGFSSQQKYNSLIHKYLGSSNTSYAISKCLSSSSNPTQYFTNNVSIAQNLTSISYLDQPENINITDLESSVQKIKQTLTLYELTQMLDIDDKQMIAELTAVSSPNQCNEDKWVPSFKIDETQMQGDNFRCQNGSTKVDNNTCFNWTGFSGTANGCGFGCIDTTLILNNMITDVGNIEDGLTLRYKNCTFDIRQPLIQNIQKIYQNYYKIKKQRISSAKSRTSTVQSTLNNTSTILNKTISPSMTKIENLLSSELLASNSSQLANSRDCRILGKDIDVSVNSFCNLVVPLVYNLRYLYYATAIIIFFITLFVVCAGSRAEKQHRMLEKAEKYENNQFQERKKRKNMLNNDNDLLPIESERGFQPPKYPNPQPYF